jgi:hypothetical protein
VAHRKFGQETQAPDREPVTFDMAHEKDIKCRGHVNGKLLIELVGKVESGSIADQSDGILKVFDITVRTDDGEFPEAYTGRRYDPRRPLENHSQAELDRIDDDNEARRERNAEIREANAALEDPDATEELLELLVQPGIDPTSSWGRLKSVLDDPNTRIDIEELAEIVGWLVEQFTGRPTKNAAGSRVGTSSTNRGSRRARRSPALTSVVPTSD